MRLGGLAAVVLLACVPGREGVVGTSGDDAAGDEHDAAAETDTPAPDAADTAEVSAIDPPARGLYIELTWRTPGDINESDTGSDGIFWSAGSDVDLHLRHPKANAFFDPRYDVSSFNPTPSWGEPAGAYDPRLTADDNDGAGPEGIALAEPEIGATYTVGVHYYSDWGYGPSLATVRVYVDGALVDEVADIELDVDDLWTSHTITIGADGDVVVQRVTEPTAHFYLSTGEPPDDRVPGGHPSLIGPSSALRGGLMILLAGASGVPARTFTWDITAPDGTTEHFDGDSRVERQAQQLGVYRFAVTMKGADGAVVAELATDVPVTDLASLRVTLVWETPGDPDPDDVGVTKDDPAGADLDLHLVRAGAALGDATGDCSYANPRPTWSDTPTNADDPRLSPDDVDGAGPETLLWLAPHGAADVVVVYADDHGYGPSIATVRAYADDELLARREAVTLVKGEVLTAFSIVDGVVVPPVGGTP